MANLTRSFDTYLDAIGEEATRLGEVAAGAMAEEVAGCPGWTVTDLVGHVAAVYRMWIGQLEAGQPDERAKSAPRDETHSPLDSLDAGASALVTLLTSVGPDAPCWNFVGEDRTARWVARRVALETTVHRFDAERAGQDISRIDLEIALDGLDERIEVILPAALRHQPEVSLAGSVCLCCADAPNAWTVEVHHGRMRSRPQRGPADAVLVGPAELLFLFTWNRSALDELDLTGSPEVARSWVQLGT